jgi:hypothetical protein
LGFGFEGVEVCKGLFELFDLGFDGCRIAELLEPVMVFSRG